MKFEHYKTWILRQHRWRLRASNGEIIAHGEGYARKADCLRAIGLVKTVAQKTPVIETKR